ncbi:hypothetical protein [Streptomyces massasporeus]|uniref:hypothetical protein n=1 Tax=Streptomyces massasporeus TaxID=67324 RepID=UPI00367DD9F5
MPREADGGSGFTRLRRDAGGSRWARGMRMAAADVTGPVIEGANPARGSARRRQ